VLQGYHSLEIRSFFKSNPPIKTVKKMIPLIFWAIGIVLILAIFLFVKLKYIKHKFTWVLIILGVLFLYVSFMLSIAGQGLELNNAEGIKSAGQVYMGWLSNAFGNMKILTTNAVKDYDWNVNSSIIGR